MRRPAPAASRTPAAPRRPVLVLTVAAVVMVITVLALAGATGQLAAVVPASFDPGAVVRYGLPITRAAHDFAAALTIGLLVLAAWAMGPDPGTPRGSRDADTLAGARLQLSRVAASAGLVWLASGAVVLVLTAADVTGLRLGSPGFAQVVFSYLAQIDLGRSAVAELVLVAVTVTVASLATRVNTLLWAAALSLISVLPMALGGHSASSGDHMNAVDSLAIHLVGVCVWVGGLAALLLVARRLGAQLPTVAYRYSTLALCCFIAVAGSGVVNAALRLGTVANLASGYGLLVVAKTIALVLLGVAGAIHRRRTLPRLTSAPSSPAFVRLVAAEVVLMGATLGLAVALSRAAPPSAGVEPEPVAALIGFPVPPPLTLARYATVFYPSLLWLVVAAGLAGGYVVGMVRLHRRGDRWPALRLVSWLAGCGVLVWVTSGGPGVYGRLYFSAHMVQHMTLMTLVPLLLVLGAPITLALRALTARADGSTGAREVLLRLVHSRPLGVLGHPVVAFVLLQGSLIAFYYTDLFSLALFTHTGHVLMTVHFLLTGYLFVWAIVGIDPGSHRLPFPFRLVLLLVALGFHAFFAISLMASDVVLAPDWWAAIGRTDPVALLADQQRGGGIAWAAGDVPSLLLGVALVVGWIRSDAIETRRRDRQADRDGDAELHAYNAYLADLAKHDGGHR